MNPGVENKAFLCFCLFFWGGVCAPQQVGVFAQGFLNIYQPARPFTITKLHDKQQCFMCSDDKCASCIALSEEQGSEMLLLRSLATPISVPSKENCGSFCRLVHRKEYFPNHLDLSPISIW